MDATPIMVPEPDPAEDAHTISRKGARMPQVEVITRGERRRVWTVEQKREIVAESLGSTLTPTEVARKHGISSGLLYGWRQKLIGGQMTLLQQSPPGFARVEFRVVQFPVGANRVHGTKPPAAGMDGNRAGDRAPHLIILPSALRQTIRISSPP